MKRNEMKLPGLLIGSLDGGLLERRVMRLLDARLPWARRWRVVSALGCMGVAAILSVGMVAVGVRPLIARAQTNITPRAFEVVSIKQNKSVMDKYRAGLTPNGYAATGIPVGPLIQSGYGLFRSDLVYGAPSWVNTERFDVEAKVAAADAADWQAANATNMTSDDMPTVRMLMFRSMLAERFKLKVHTETRELPVYELVAAKGGSKLKEAKQGDTYPDGLAKWYHQPIAGGVLMPTGPSQVVGQGASMAQLARELSRMLQGRNIVDKTGLMGRYDFTLQYSLDRDFGPAQPAGGGSAGGSDATLPGIFTAVQEQLGLRLVQAKGPVEVLVIDHIERPTEN